jgi:hypothetical protein
VKKIPKVVVFSIGGNDLQFAPILEKCVAAKAAATAAQEASGVWLVWTSAAAVVANRKCRDGIDDAKVAIEANEHRDRVDTAISRIRDVTSHKTYIVVMGYPGIFSKKAEGATCPVPPYAARRIHRMVRMANASAIRAAKEYRLLGHRVIFLGELAHPEFAGHRLCDGNGSNDWFNGLQAGPPEAFHPNYSGYRAEGRLLAECVKDLDACLLRPTIRSSGIINRSRISGGTIGTVEVSEDYEPDPAAPSVPAAPTISVAGGKFSVTWSPAAGAEFYSIEFADGAGGANSVAELTGTQVFLPFGIAPAGSCVHVVAVAGDEDEVAGPCTQLPSVQPPIVSSAKEGMCKNQWQTRSLAKYASDPDSPIASYTVVKTSFDRSGFNFTWNADGSYTMKIPPGTKTNAKLKITWFATDVTGLSSKNAVLTIDATSCGPDGIAPVAKSATEGMAVNQWQTRSLAKYASDPDSPIASFTVVQTSFDRSGFNFSWKSNGEYTMKIPPTTKSSTKLSISWYATDTTGLVSNTATLTIKVAKK